jgi:tetratricopeptide (TPR) repeat protein
MTKQIEENPKNSRYPYIFGTFLAQINQMEQSEKYLLKAIELSPTKQAIRIPLLRIYSATDQGEKALQLAKETFELDTSKKYLWKEYVKTAARFDKDLSIQLINEQIEKNNKWVEELLKENISRTPDVLQNRISLAAFYFQIGNTASSSEVIDQAIIDFPEAESEIKKVRNLQNI